MIKPISDTRLKQMIRESVGEVLLVATELLFRREEIKRIELANERMKTLLGEWEVRNG